MAKFNPNKTTNTSDANQQPKSKKTEKPKAKTKRQKKKYHSQKQSTEHVPAEMQQNINTMVAWFKQPKVYVTILGIAALLIVLFLVKVFRPDPVEQTLNEPDTQQEMPTTDEGFQAQEMGRDEVKEQRDQPIGDDSSPYFKQNQVFPTFYIPTESENEDENEETDLRQGEMTYLNPEDKELTSLTLVNQEAPLQSAIQLAQTPLYGFAAFKNTKTNDWIRVPYIQPIPEVEENNKAYGGMSMDDAKAEIDKRHKEADAIYERAMANWTEKTLNLKDISQAKDEDPTKTLDAISERIRQNADHFARPLYFYTQDFYPFPLTSQQLDKIKEGYYINYFDTYYYGIVRKDTVDTLNAVNQNLAKQMMNNWGLTVSHNIQLYPDKSYIIIDGVAYRYNQIVLDLYDNPNAESNGRKNILQGQEDNTGLRKSIIIADNATQSQ